MSTRDLVLSALFAAIIVALGLLPPIMLGFIPVPITAQSMGVMLAGVILGAKRGTIAVLLVLLLAAIGLPVLSGGRGGLAVFAAPTTGFLIGWVFAAFVTGYLSERFVKNSQGAMLQTAGFFAAAVAGGVVVLYAFGISYLAVVSGLGLTKAFVGSMAFIPGDLVKAAVAALAGRAVMVGYPLLPARA
ncbi:BioY family transporter [Pseudorhizobium endolithicum]|uniref:Biotin transporter n=1 Tax=Pseudorhizobium endolithicum TaxID=1191678 RepID=A0ABM8PWV3_9HYPH|nr:biotin transporter BioY [Pseudorhizobium endolithicum]CAD6422727.1 BioY family transporter [Rhizobium sp. Q54]CAD7052833.1 BioY family transporter [Pseudorhizobium endolithicum]